MTSLSGAKYEQLKQRASQLLEAMDEQAPLIVSDGVKLITLGAGGKLLELGFAQALAGITSKLKLESASKPGVGGKLKDELESTSIKAELKSETLLKSDDVTSSQLKEFSWSYWKDYNKLLLGDKEYAKIGDWLYTRHAIENLYPSNLGMVPGHTSNHHPINLSAKFINSILNDRTIEVINIKKDGIARAIYKAGDIEIVTEGRIVVTVKRIN